MNLKEISAPVAIAIAVVALILFVGAGYWFMNRPNGPTKDQSAAFIKGDMQQLQQRQPPAGTK